MATPGEQAEHDVAAEKKIISDVETYGFHVAIVPGDGYSPNFAYTIGLFRTYGYPELICFGLNQDLLHSVLWSGKNCWMSSLYLTKVWNIHIFWMITMYAF